MLVLSGIDTVLFMQARDGGGKSDDGDTGGG